MGIVFDKAETAGCFVEPVQAHHEALDLAAFREEFVDLFFGCVEGSGKQVSYWTNLLARRLTDCQRRGWWHWRGDRRRALEVGHSSPHRDRDRVFAYSKGELAAMDGCEVKKR